MNGDSGALDSYNERLEGFRKSDAERDALVAELIKNHAALQLKTSEQALDQQKQVSGASNFALAVLDGDGAIFQDFLYAQDSNVSDWSIVVYVILNLQGLGMKLASENIISNLNELAVFGRAFGAAQPHFNFIDVGAGKERADHKVRETLRLYLPNAQCRHVFFGPCHDKGYLPALEPYRGAYASKITLIETVPAETGFAQLGLQRMNIPQAFRDKNLPSRYPGTGTSFQASGGGARLPSNARIPSMDSATAAISPPPTSTSPAPSASSQAASASSWAAIGKGTTGKSFDVSSRPAPKKRYLLLNAYDERLDPGRSWDRFTELTQARGRNFCNNHHLGDKCESGDYCEYLHGPKLTNGELLVLKNKARSIYCSNKSYCRDMDCYLGHHCKFGSTCSTSKCRFGETHNVDLEPARRYYEDGSEEWLPQFLEKHTRG
ncbi:hypothetical protein KC356_g2939 [Hortaea werneckii]|nr:hypothetical protein KC356_g2939 [Hortaea werneckii]